MGRTPAGTATRTRPAPPRRAAPPHRTAAPDMPRLPATTRTRPKSPLWLSAARGGSDGTLVTRVGASVGMGVDPLPQLGGELLAELSHLGGDDRLAVALAGVVAEVALVIRLRRVERRER